MLTRVGGSETLRWIVVDLAAADVVPWLIGFFDDEFPMASRGVSEFLGSVPRDAMMTTMSKTLPEEPMNAALALLGEVWQHFAPPSPSQEQPAEEAPPPAKEQPEDVSKTEATDAAVPQVEAPPKEAVKEVVKKMVTEGVQEVVTEGEKEVEKEG